MSVVSVTAYNFRGLEDFKFSLNGKSVVVIGDSETFKSTVIEIILSCLMLQDFAKEPLTTGKEEGSIGTVYEIEGVKYSIKRTFSKTSKGRFTVVDENGGRYSATEMLKKIYGAAFGGTVFDYHKFFFGFPNSTDRFEYLLKCSGGNAVMENIRKAGTLKRQRGKLGTRKNELQVLIDDSPLNPETFESDLEYYAKAREQDEAMEVRTKKLLERIIISTVTEQLISVKEENQKFADSQDRVSKIDARIEELKKELAELDNEKAGIEKWQSQNQPDLELQSELELKISNAEITNKEIEEEADKLYHDEIFAINEFNKRREELNNTITNFNLFTEASKEWEELDKQIKDLHKLNHDTFYKNLPLPGLTYEEYEIQDRNGNPKTEVELIYDGRELMYENLSTGKSIMIAIEIQRLINPKGMNFVVIPEAQSLGSKLDSIREECKKYDLQAIIEMTEYKKKLSIKFSEDYFKEKKAPASKRKSAITKKIEK